MIGVNLFNSSLLPQLPLGSRMIAMPLTYWLIALVPILLAVLNHTSWSEFGFVKGNVLRQILTGLGLALALSLLLTVIPHLAGCGNWVDNGKRYKYFWQFAYDLFYSLFVIGAVEEFVFRGFFYSKIKRLSHSEVIPVLASSVLFGLLHLASGNILQLIVTGCLGTVFCLCRVRIKNCSPLSLILAHGLYDCLITVWAVVF